MRYQTLTPPHVAATPNTPKGIRRSRRLEKAQLCLAEQLRSMMRQLGQISAQLSQIKFPTTVGNFSGGVGDQDQPPFSMREIVNLNSLRDHRWGLG
jgi:hypothetical protein